MIIVTRSLSVSDYGTWGLINGLLIFPILLEPIISYWAVREIARGDNSGKTAFFSSSMFTLLGIIVYFLAVIMVTSQTDVDENILILSIILVPVIFLNKTLREINSVWKPEGTAYGIVILSISQLVLGVILVYSGTLELSSVILIVFVSYIIANIFLAIFAKEKLKGKFMIQNLKKWLKKSWLPTYPAISLTIERSDIVIFSMITNSLTGLGFWTAMMVIGHVIGNAALMSRGLYGKILGGGSDQVFQKNILHVCYFLFPITIMLMIFARPLLFLLNPVYEVVFSTAVIVFFGFIFHTLTGVFWVALLGRENVDVGENKKTIDYVKSKLFSYPTLRIVQFGGYVIVLSIVLFLAVLNDLDEGEILFLWAIIFTLSQIPLCLYFFLHVRKIFNFKVTKNIFYYLITSLVSFVPIHFVMEEFLTYNENLFEFAPIVLFYMVCGVGIYLCITTVTDKETKSLFKEVINELRGRN